MRVKTTTRHCDIPDDQRARTEELVRRLSRYEPAISSGEIIFEPEGHGYRVEGILSVAGASPVVAKGQDSDVATAVDRMIDRLGRQLRRQRSQRRDHQAPSHDDFGASAPG